MLKKGGCILINSQKEVALVYRDKFNDYTFPKGHIEPYETIKECALRETIEETGRECVLLTNEPIAINKYTNYEGEIITYLYLAKDTGKTKRNIAEKDKETFRWIPFDEVANTLTYPDLKTTWQEAIDIIKPYL